MFNSVIKTKPDIVFKLPCGWNLQLSDNTRSEICYSNTRRDLNLIHFNSPKKLNVQNKDVEHFRNLYKTFVQFDGNLLRHDLINCQNKTDAIKKDSSSVVQAEDGCYELKQAGATVYRTHPYFLPYSSSTGETFDVTLTAQLSMDRLHMVEDLCRHWSGPMSLALYLSDSEADQFVHFAQASEAIKDRHNIGFHIVYRDPHQDFYPINYLRNVGLEHVNTEFVFVTDIDFLPGVDTYQACVLCSTKLEKRFLNINHFSISN